MRVIVKDPVYIYIYVPCLSLVDYGSIKIIWYTIKASDSESVFKVLKLILYYYCISITNYYAEEEY